MEKAPETMNHSLRQLLMLTADLKACIKANYKNLSETQQELIYQSILGAMTETMRTGK